MHINQVSSLINATASEMWGKEAMTVKDATSLVSLGNKVLSSETDKDRFLGILVDRIKRTVFRTLDLDLDMPNLLMPVEAYFGILQKVDIQPVPTAIDNSWNIGEIDYTPKIWDIAKPEVSQKLFDNINTFTIPITIPDVMYKSAFLEGTMDDFIVRIFSTIESCLIMYVNGLTHLVLCALVAEKVKRQKAVNVYELFVKAFPSTTLAYTDFLTSPDMLKYTGMVIRNYVGYLADAGILYNEDGKVRATQRTNLHVIFLRDFVSAYTTYYSADTFHQEMTSLPLYQEISALQAPGNDPVRTFEDNSAFNIIPPSEADEDVPTAISGSGIIAVLADRQALGVSLTEDWSGSDRNNRERYTNITYGVNRGYMLDLGENAVVFYVGPYSAGE